MNVTRPALGIRFDIDKVDSADYGDACWKIFWRAVDTTRVAGATLYEGDSAATLGGRENVYCLAVQTVNGADLAAICAALGGDPGYLQVAAEPKFVEAAALAREPLPEAGRVDASGAFSGGYNARHALEAVRRARGEVMAAPDATTTDGKGSEVRGETASKPAGPEPVQTPDNTGVQQSAILVLGRSDDPDAALSPLPAEPSPGVEATPASSTGLAPAEMPQPYSNVPSASTTPPTYTRPTYTPPAETSRLAIASLATGIATWLILPLVGAVVAVVTGHLAKKQIRRNPERVSGTGLATAGLALGYAQLGLVLLIAIVTGIMTLAARPGARPSDSATAIPAPVMADSAATAADKGMARTASMAASYEPTQALALQLAESDAVALRTGPWAGDSVSFDVDADGNLHNFQLNAWIGTGHCALDIGDVPVDAIGEFLYASLMSEADYWPGSDRDKFRADNMWPTPLPAPHEGMVERVRITGKSDGADHVEGTYRILACGDQQFIWATGRGTSTWDASPKEQNAAPTLASTATPAPTSRATAVPTLTPTAVSGPVSLAEALDQGLADIQILGTGAASGNSVLMVAVTSGGSSSTVKVEPGLVLHSAAPGEQDMVVRRLLGWRVDQQSYNPADLIYLTGIAGSQTYAVEAYCLNFHKDNPSSGTGFTLGSVADPDVIAILGAADRVPGANADIMAIQAAIWAVTDDPTWPELDERGYSPDHERVRALLQEAGLDPTCTALFGGACQETPQASEQGSQASTISPSAWTASLAQVKELAHSEEEMGQDLAWAPDGRTIAVAANNLHFFVPGLDQEVRQVEGLQWVRSLAYSPDGKMVAWSNHDGLRLWDVASGDDIRSFDSLQNAGQLAYSPDGTLLAVAHGAGQKVTLLEVATGRAVQTFTSACCAPDTVAFSPDGKTLAWGADSVYFGDIASGEILHVLTEDHGAVLSVAFSPDGNLLAAGYIDNAIALYDPADGRLLRTLTGHTGQVTKVIFSPDGGSLASASFDKAIKIWDVDTGQELRTLTGHTDWVTALAFSPDGTMLASGGNDCALRIWGPPNAAAAVSVPPPAPTSLPPTIRVKLKTLLESEWAHQVAWSPNGKLLAVDAYHIVLYDAQTLKQVHVIDSVQWANSIAFSPDNTMLAAASHDGIKVWNTASWDELRSIPGTGDAQHVDWSPDGALLAVSIQQAIKVIDFASGEERFTLNAGSYGSNLAFAPDGRSLVAQGSGGLKRWDIATGQEAPLPSRLVKEGGNTALAFSPDGQFLATASSDKTIRLWKTQGWDYLHTLSGHTGDINALAFTPDGQRLASASSDLTIRLWDVPTGKPLNVLTGHTDRVNSIAFSPDGRLLASGATDNAVRVWSLGDGTTDSAPAPEPAATLAPTSEPLPSPTAAAPTAAPTARSASPTRAPTRPKPTSAPAAVCPDPRVRITYPANGATISGVTNFIGTANLPDQAYYKFEYKPADGPTWQFLTQFDGKSVVNDKLMDFFTTTIAPGVYDFRLIAVDRSGNYPAPCEIRVTVQR